MRRVLVLDDMVQDFRISFRGLLRLPMMALTIIATVGLGIGATTAIFSAINAALLRPLPYHDAERLVRIYTDSPPNRFRFSVVDYQALDAQQTTFERIAGFTDREVAFSDGEVAERIRGRVVTWTYFSLLGIRPALGRDFTDADDRPGSPPVAIVTHGFWQRRLGGRPDVIGEAHSARRRRSHARRRPSVDEFSARATSGLLCGRAVASAVAQRTFLRHRARTAAKRSRRGQPRRKNCAPSTSASFRCGSRRIRTSAPRGRMTDLKDGRGR